jgi:6-pyruvoyltetrahydropterin/6-carboxytetrahydropterin synthase
VQIYFRKQLVDIKIDFSKYRIFTLQLERMSNIRITKQFSFETGHALYGYDGKCRNVHGHSYRLSVTVFGQPIDDTSHVKYGMVIDFSDLKKIVKEEIVDVFDHATVFNKNTPHVELAKELADRGHNVLLVNYQPTSEMMVIDFAEKIKARLPKNIRLHSLKLQETATSYAEWFASEN